MKPLTLGHTYTVTYSDHRHTYDFWITPASEDKNGYNIRVDTDSNKNRGLTYYTKEHLNQLANKQWTIHYPNLLPEELFEL